MTLTTMRQCAVLVTENMMRNKAEKFGWKYEYSKVLKIEYAYRMTPNGIETMTADKVRYSPAEVVILSQAGGISRGVHLVKKVFEGEIVEK